MIILSIFKQERKNMLTKFKKDYSENEQNELF